MSKFDEFIMYDPKKDRIVLMKWDGSTNRVADWFHCDGEKVWQEHGNAYISQAKKKYVVIDRIPEHIHRAY